MSTPRPRRWRRRSLARAVRRRRAEGVIRGFLEKRAFVVVLLHEPQFGLLASVRRTPRPSRPRTLVAAPGARRSTSSSPPRTCAFFEELLALGEHAVAGLLVLFDPRQFPQAPRLVRDGRVLELVVRVHVRRLCVRLRVRDGGLALELELEEPAALSARSSVRLIARRPLGVGVRDLFAVRVSFFNVSRFARAKRTRVAPSRVRRHRCRSRPCPSPSSRSASSGRRAASRGGTRLLVGGGVARLFFLDGQALLLPRAPRGEPRARGARRRAMSSSSSPPRRRRIRPRTRRAGRAGPGRSSGASPRERLR